MFLGDGLFVNVIVEPPNPINVTEYFVDVIIHSLLRYIMKNLNKC